MKEGHTNVEHFADENLIRYLGQGCAQDFFRGGARVGEHFPLSKTSVENWHFLTTFTPKIDETSYQMRQKKHEEDRRAEASRNGGNAPLPLPVHIPDLGIFQGITTSRTKYNEKSNFVQFWESSISKATYSRKSSTKACKGIYVKERLYKYQVFFNLVIDARKMFHQYLFALQRGLNHIFFSKPSI